jgi:hypothetical protein
VLLTRNGGPSAAASPTLEFELQFVVPAEELECGASARDLRRVKTRVQDVLGLATGVCLLLEPCGWRLVTVRFDEEVCVTLTKQGGADGIAEDLANLPESFRAEIGQSVHLCATLGDHVYELQLDGGRLKPLSPADWAVVHHPVE